MWQSCCVSPALCAISLFASSRHPMHEPFARTRSADADAAPAAPLKRRAAADAAPAAPLKRPAAAAAAAGAGKTAEADGPLYKHALYQGSALQEYLQHAWKKLGKQERGTIRSNLRNYDSTLATMCSGTGMGEIVFHAINALVEKQEAHLFHACEIVPFKQKHLMNVVAPALNSTRSCLFKDFADLPSGAGTCVVHSCKCEVGQKPFLAIVGYSCKNLSLLNSQHQQPRGEILAQRVGSSGSTCQNLLDYVGMARPRVAVLENVEEMGKPECESKNVAYLHNHVRSHGYAVMSKTLLTSRRSTSTYNCAY